MSTLMLLLDVRLSSIVLGTILHGESSFFRPLQQPVSTLVYTDPCTVEILGFAASLTPILHVYKNLIMFWCLGFGVRSKTFLEIALVHCSEECRCLLLICLVISTSV